VVLIGGGGRTKKGKGQRKEYGKTGLTHTKGRFTHGNGEKREGEKLEMGEERVGQRKER